MTNNSLEGARPSIGVATEIKVVPGLFVCSSSRKKREDDLDLKSLNLFMGQDGPALN